MVANFISPLIWYLIGALFLVFLYSLFIEPYRIEVTRYTKKSPVIVPLTIAHITDLHSSEEGRNEKALLKLIKEENPDLIVLTGDLISSKSDYLFIQSYLEKLKAPMGVWIVKGNWENWNPYPTKRSKELSSLESRTLINESLNVGNNLWLVGLNDYSSGASNVELALKKVPASGVVLALFHSPMGFHEISNRCNIALAGHTHGGQFRLPGFPPFWLPEGSGKYVAGWYEENGCEMYVNRGLGTSMLPLRFFSRPEVSFITLEP